MKAKVKHGTDELNIRTSDLLFGPADKGGSSEYKHLEGLALEAWNTDEKGKIKSSTKLIPEKKTLDEKMFDIPADYEKMDMMLMMQMMQGNPEMMQQMQMMFGGEK